MRAVLDTNVIVSAVLFGGVPQEIIASAARGEFILVTSQTLLDELAEVLVGKFGWAPEVARAAQAEVETLARSVIPVAAPRVFRDPDDDALLAVAAAGDAEFVVRGDRDVVEMSGHGDIAIVSPRTFLGILRSRKLT